MKINIWLFFVFLSGLVSCSIKVPQYSSVVNHFDIKPRPSCCDSVSVVKEYSGLQSNGVLEVNSDKLELRKKEVVIKNIANIKSDIIKNTDISKKPLGKLILKRIDKLQNKNGIIGVYLFAYAFILAFIGIVLAIVSMNDFFNNTYGKPGGSYFTIPLSILLIIISVFIFKALWNFLSEI